MRTFYPSLLSNLELVHATTKQLDFGGRHALQMVESEASPRGQHSIAIFQDSDFTDGVIEAELAGSPRANASEGMRGFVGIAFRVQPHASQFECFYLRPTNGRSEDQLRRNHATQYISHPDYPWFRLRDENPGVYESYTDLAAGEWTRIKIVVAGYRAQLHVNGAEQPSLIVNDLKLSAIKGRIGLWIGPGTEAYLSELSYTLPHE